MLKKGMLLIFFCIQFQTNKMRIEIITDPGLGENLPGHLFTRSTPGSIHIYKNSLILGSGFFQGFLVATVKKIDSLC